MGAGHLLALLLEDTQTDAESLLLLSQHALLHGNCTFASKPDIPTYLVGDAAAVQAFCDYVPAPVETYTRLYWSVDTSELVTYLAQKAAEERAAQKAKKQLMQPPAPAMVAVQ